MVVRFFIVAGFILALVAAGGSFSIYQSYQTEREQRLDAESKFMQAQDSAAAIKADMEQQKSRVVDLEGQVESLKKESQNFKTQQAAKDTEIQSLKNDIASKSEELLKLKGQLETYKQKERIPAAVGTNVSGLAGAAAPSSTTPVLKLEPSGASAVIPAEAPPSDDSRILTVNRKFNFIVVNLGLRDGLRMGDKVQVVQGGNPKASAQIEKIYDKFSAATLLDEDKGNPVHEGDSVRKG